MSGRTSIPEFKCERADNVRPPQSGSESPAHHVAYPVDNETPSCAAIMSCMPCLCLRRQIADGFTLYRWC